MGRSMLLTSSIIKLLSLKNLGRTSPQELGAVILHELGHRKMKHLQKKAIFGLVVAGIFLASSSP